MDTVWNRQRCEWCGAAIIPEHIDRNRGHSFCPFCEGITPLPQTADGPPPAPPFEASDSSGAGQHDTEGAEAERTSPNSHYRVTESDGGLTIRYTRPIPRVFLAGLGLLAISEIAIALLLKSMAAYIVTSLIVVAYVVAMQIKHTTLLTIARSTIDFRPLPIPGLPNQTLRPTQLWVQRNPSNTLNETTYRLMASDQSGRSIALVPFGHPLQDMRALEHRIEQHLKITNRPVSGEVEQTHEP